MDEHPVLFGQGHRRHLEKEDVDRRPLFEEGLEKRQQLMVALDAIDGRCDHRKLPFLERQNENMLRGRHLAVVRGAI